MKIEQERVMTAIVGSYPKGENIIDKEGRALPDDCGLIGDVNHSFLREARLPLRGTSGQGGAV